MAASHGVVTGDGRGLVLGGGGLTGIAWTAGVLLGLSESGVEIFAADRILGTSAGAVAAARMADRHALAALFDAQTDAASQVEELAPDAALLAAMFAQMPSLLAIDDTVDRARAFGTFARSAATVAEAPRRAVIAARLAGADWPARPVSLVAVDAETGAAVQFDRNSGVALIDAVAASCAVPGLWPPVTIAGRRYVDGGVRSFDNADLAEDCGRLLLVSPAGPTPVGRLPEHLALLAARGVRVQLIAPDEAARQAMGADPFDTSRRAPAARQGRAQGRDSGPAVAAFWNGAA